jgi:hypothetical protein
MSARVRWIILGVVLVVLGVAAVYWLNASLTMSTVETRVPKTWVTGAGTTLTIEAKERHPDDRFGCGGPSHKAPRVAFTQWVPGGSMRTAADGSVTLRCYEGDTAST